jgi:hypothetical protein
MLPKMIQMSCVLEHEQGLYIDHNLIEDGMIRWEWARVQNKNFVGAREKNMTMETENSLNRIKEWVSLKPTRVNVQTPYM